MSDEVRTYAEVAQWLPTDVREHIEATRPCEPAGHDWEHTRTELHRWGQAAPVAVIEHWLCRNCAADVQTDPSVYR